MPSTSRSRSFVHVDALGTPDEKIHNTLLRQTLSTRNTGSRSVGFFCAESLKCMLVPHDVVLELLIFGTMGAVVCLQIFLISGGNC